MKKILIDKELDLNRQDYLNTKEYAETLEDLIISANKDIPLTIGLFGEWGSGKSSIINTVKNKLEADKNHKTKFIIYDAWKYSNDSFRRMFLKKVQEELKLKMTDFMSSFYINRNEEVEINRKINIPFLIYLIFAAFFLVLIAVNTGFSIDWSISLTIVISLLGFAITVYSRAFNDYKVTVQKPMVFAPEQFEDGFKEILAKGLKRKTMIDKVTLFINGEGTKNYDRIVIVIDNIDRCHRNIAYELLTNTKNFIENGFNVIFLIPVDDGALKKHIFKSDGGNSKEGEEFLRKYFNLTIRIKPYKLTEIYDYSLKLNSNNNLGFQPDTINIIAKEYASNPRRILQFFNNLQLEIDLLKKKYGNEFIKNNEKLICKFLVIREEWPEYFKELSSNPSSFFNEKNGVENDAESKDLIKFLRETKVITNNIDFTTLERILVNSDKFGHIPDSVIDFIDDGNFESLKIELSNLSLNEGDVLDSLIIGLKSAQDRGLNETDVPLLLNRIVYLFNHYSNLDVYLYNKLETNLLNQNSDLSDLFRNCISLNNLVDYSFKANEHGKPYLKQSIVTIIKEYSNGSIIDEFGAELYQLYLNLCSKQDVSEIQPVFDLYYKQKEKGPIEDLKIIPEKLSILIDRLFINKYMIEEDTFIENDLNKKNWEFLSLSIEDRTELLDEASVYAFAIAQKPQLTVEIISSIIDTLLLLFGNSNKANLLYNVNLNNLNTLLFGDIHLRKPGYSSAPTTYLANIKGEDVIHTIEYLFQCYRLTNGEAEVINKFSDWNDDYPSEFQSIMSVFVQENDKLNFHKLKPIILEFSSLSIEQLNIIEHTILAKDVAGFIYEENELYSIIKRIVDTNLANDDLEKIIEVYKNDERAQKTLKRILSELSIEEISGLTSSLKTLTLDQLTQEDTLMQINNNFDLIKFIAINGEQKHQESILPLLKVKINTLNPESLSSTLEVVKSINDISIQEYKDLLSQVNQNSVSKVVEDKKLLSDVKKHLQLKIKETE